MRFFLRQQHCKREVRCAAHTGLTALEVCFINGTSEGTKMLLDRELMEDGSVPKEPALLGTKSRRDSTINR